MRRLLFWAMLLVAVSISAKTFGKQRVEVLNLRVENLCNPQGIDTAAPRFSWQLQSDEKGVLQQSYRILVASSEELLARGEGDLWDSGDVKSRQQLWVPYGGRRLRSGQHVCWKLQVMTNKGRSAWSEPQTFGIALLNESDWQGRWIGLERFMDGEQTGNHSRMAARYLRKEFSLKDGSSVVRATAYVVGLGLYQFYVNGRQLAPFSMMPVPTDYRQTIYYNTFDVTSLLASRNAFGLVLGNGYYFAIRQDKPYKNTHFGFPKCRMNVVVEYADGTREVWKTDETWRVTAEGPIRANNLYDGEEYDARRELTGWNRVGFDDSQWLQAERTALPMGTLCAQMMDSPRQRLATEGDGFVAPLPADGQSNGSLRFDMGENMTGFLAFRPAGEKGDTIRLRYAERLNADGSLYTENLRSARCEDVYVCRGDEQDWWQPAFVYHGFRYVEVVGVRNREAWQFRKVYVDNMQPDYRFVTSDSTLNRIVRNAANGIRCNYQGMPLDCPQRDERMPWLGDRTMGSLGESYLFPNERLYAKWMRDICEAQRADGCLPDVAPLFWNYFSDNVTWPAALPFTCDMLWRQYGNAKPFADSYPHIKKWIRHLVEAYGDADGIITKDTYGDWCVPPERLELIHSEDPARKTDGALLSTAYVIRVLHLLRDFASAQGLAAEADEFQQQAQAMAAAFNKRFLTREGTEGQGAFYGNNTSTANLLPLAFGLVPDDCRAGVVGNLVKNIVEKNQCHVSCGVIGISWLLRVLSDNGRADVAWRLATTKTYPSWGYMAEHGATTIWELWNGDTANPAMNSGNHVMLLGDLLTWCYQYLAGVKPKRPTPQPLPVSEGSEYLLAPDFSIPDCFSVDARYESPYGPVVSQWQKDGRGHVRWQVAIPANTTATLRLADGKEQHIGSGAYVFESSLPAITTPEGITAKKEFIDPQPAEPSCHASTIVELQNGDLLAAWFAGKYEGHPDVKIWTSRRPKGSQEWTKPVIAATGTFEVEPGKLITDNEQARIAGLDSTDHGRKACYNPVLCQMPDGEVLLFYKIGRFVQDWTGWLVRSSDNGQTWSQHEPLPAGFLGPVKNKPELFSTSKPLRSTRRGAFVVKTEKELSTSHLLCPSSTEKGGWKIHFERYDLIDGKHFPESEALAAHATFIGPIEAEQAEKTYEQGKLSPVGCIQPSILRLADGRLKVLCRSQHGRLATSESSDGGQTWSKVTLTDLPNNNSGTDAVTVSLPGKKGRVAHLLVYNPTATPLGEHRAPRTPLCVAISDDGEHWRHLLTLEDGPISEYSYPAIIQGRDGTVHLIYTWRRERICHAEFQLP